MDKMGVMANENYCGFLSKSGYDNLRQKMAAIFAKASSFVKTSEDKAMNKPLLVMPVALRIRR